MIGILKANLIFLKTKYQRFFPMTFFVLGFLFDILTLGRIDQTWTIVQQAIFLALAAILVFLELFDSNQKLTPRTPLRKLWENREFLIHFFFGSLLSAYTLFYFKSSSAFVSFIFLAFLASLLIANEMERFRSIGVPIRMLILSLCIQSYLSYLVPTLMGFVGWTPFLISTLGTLGIWILLLRWISKRIKSKPFLLKRFFLPATSIQAIFFLLYILEAIPPVPLSIQYIGIYHGVEKSKGQYELSYSRPWWKFWQNGDQTFAARAGDSLYCFARIFSPTRFRDKIQVRWLKKDPSRGWTTWDVIPINIVGGRDEGYRGYVYKSNYEPGRWRIQIETSDDREIGRIHFNVVADSGSDPREYRKDIY